MLDSVYNVTFPFLNAYMYPELSGEWSEEADNVTFPFLNAYIYPEVRGQKKQTMSQYSRFYGVK